MISTIDKNNTFSFDHITADYESQKAKHLDINKATQKSNITMKLVK